MKANTYAEILETPIEGRRIKVQAVWQSFSDKILLLVTPSGKLGQMISVSLAAGRASASISSGVGGVSSGGLGGGEGITGMYEVPAEEMDMLPDVPLTPRFLMGASTDARGDMASTLSVQIASLLRRLAPDDGRTLVFGLTLPGSAAFWADDNGENDEVKAMLFPQIIHIVSMVRI